METGAVSCLVSEMIYSNYWSKHRYIYVGPKYPESLEILCFAYDVYWFVNYYKIDGQTLWGLWENNDN